MWSTYGMKMCIETPTDPRSEPTSSQYYWGCGNILDYQKSTYSEQAETHQVRTRLNTGSNWVLAAGHKPQGFTACTETRDFETSWDLGLRCLTTEWIEALILVMAPTG